MSDARNYVSPEQIAQARQVGTLDYLQRYEPGELTKTYSANGKTMHCKPGEYRTKTHDSLAVHGNWFYWWSRGFGGRSALDYLVKVKEMPFQDAVRTLTAEAPVLAGQPVEVPQTAPVQNAEPEQKELRLPPESRDTSRVFAYLSKTRGMSSRRLALLPPPLHGTVRALLRHTALQVVFGVQFQIFLVILGRGT